MDLSAVLVATAMALLAVMSGWASEAAAADVTEKGTSVGCICSGVKWEERTFALNKPSVFEGACRDEDFVADAGAEGADECKDGAVWNEPTCGQVADYFAGHHGAETCEDLRRSFQTVEAYDDVLTNCCVTRRSELAVQHRASRGAAQTMPNSLQTIHGSATSTRQLRTV